MQHVLHTLGCQTLRSSHVVEGRYLVDGQSPEHLTIASDARVELVVSNAEGRLLIDVERGARLSLVRLVTEAGHSSQLEMSLGEAATCYATDVILSATESKFDVKLSGSHSLIEIGGVFIISDNERASVCADVAHNVPDTRSRIKYKGVASHQARGKFSGLVYVAPDAQRTDSEQLSRNVTMAQARIETLPQLEIYADDVKCSHGATVGQLDDQAVLYMRQRGLSLEMAKRLQIEGFVSDVVLHSAIDDYSDKLCELLHAKLQTL